MVMTLMTNRYCSYFQSSGHNFENYEIALLALDNSDMVLYITKISYNSRYRCGNCWGDQNFTYMHAHARTHTHTLINTHTHTAAHFISFFFFEKETRLNRNNYWEENLCLCWNLNLRSPVLRTVRPLRYIYQPETKFSLIHISIQDSWM